MFSNNILKFSLEGYWKEPNEKVTFFAWDLYVLETFSIVKKVVLNYLRETYFCLPRILFLYLFHDSLNFFYPHCTILPWLPGDVMFFILVWQAFQVAQGPVYMLLYLLESCGGIYDCSISKSWAYRLIKSAWNSAHMAGGRVLVTEKNGLKMLIFKDAYQDSWQSYLRPSMNICLSRNQIILQFKETGIFSMAHCKIIIIIKINVSDKEIPKFSFR